MKNKRIKVVFSVIILTALMLVIAPFAAPTRAYAANNYVSWSYELDEDTGEYTSVTATWTKVLNASAYFLYLSKDGENIWEDFVSTNSYDASYAILNMARGGRGSYVLDVEPYIPGSTPDHLISDEFILDTCTLTIRMDGHGEDIVVKNVKEGSNIAKIIKKKFVDVYCPGSNNPYFIDGKGNALVGFSYIPWTNYSDMEGLENVSLYLFPGGVTYWGENIYLDVDADVYANWFTIIKNIEVTVGDLVCSTETNTPETDGSWKWSQQTNRPVVTTSDDEDCPYNTWLPSSWWVMPDDENTPFIGTMTGGQSYALQTDVYADYGYIFPYDVDSLADMKITVNGAELTNYFFGYNDYGHGSISLLCNAEAKHEWEGGEITKATPSADGVIAGKTCIHCGETIEATVISRPATITLSKTKYNYNGKACKPAVTVKDAAGNVISASNYTVSYANNVNAGKATVTVTFKGNYYSGSKKATFTIAKIANTMTVKGKTAKVKYSVVSKKNQNLKVASVLEIKNPKGTRTYAKASGNAKIVINKKTGVVTVKKGLKKGTYKVKVKVTAAGNTNYNKVTKTVTFTIKVV